MTYWSGEQPVHRALLLFDRIPRIDQPQENGQEFEPPNLR